jgi:hypothetical protein
MHMVVSVVLIVAGFAGRVFGYSVKLHNFVEMAFLYKAIQNSVDGYPVA